MEDLYESLASHQHAFGMGLEPMLAFMSKHGMPHQASQSQNSLQLSYIIKLNLKVLIVQQYLKLFET